VDVDGLARLFTGPGLFGEFTVSSYFRDVKLLWPPVTPTQVDQPLHDLFAETIAELCADAETVGLSLSGGLDSLAVLIHVLALRPRRRVTAFVADLVDDDGDHTPEVVRHLLAELGVADRVRLVAVDPADCHAAPPWSPFGPRPDALPLVNTTVAGLAAAEGADVLLSGDGADELLAAPRFATAQVSRGAGFRGARRYLRDVARTGPGVLGECTAVVADRLPAGVRMRMYWGANWPEWTAPDVSPVLAGPWRDPARVWARQWVDTTIRSHVEAQRSWAEADVVDAWWPRCYRPPLGPVREVSPFVQDTFVAAALALPLAARYDPGGRSVYHRMKGAVVGLFPPDHRAVLPPKKRTYRAALAAAHAGSCVAPRSVAIGLLDPDALARETDTATRMMISAVEAWLEGGAEAGVAGCG
jgi:hypothetical protein